MPPTLLSATSIHHPLPDEWVLRTITSFQEFADHVETFRDSQDDTLHTRFDGEVKTVRRHLPD